MTIASAATRAAAWVGSRRSLSFTGVRGYAQALLAVGLCALASWLLDPVLRTVDLGLVFLSGVLFTAARAGVGPAVFASLLSFFALNFLFAEPRFTFSVAASEDLLSLVFLLLAALVTGQLAARLRSEVDAQTASGERLAQLHDFSRRLHGAVDEADLASVLSKYVGAALACEAVVLTADLHPQLKIAAGSAGRDGLTDLEAQAAGWTREHREPSGAGTKNFAASQWYFVPLLDKRSGSVLGIRLQQRRRLNGPQHDLLIAMRDQASTALEKLRLAAEIERSRWLNETDKLRSALLSSVSHDLRTPLVSIKGAATALLELDDALSAADKRELVENLLGEADRLNRYIQNLLEMTRLGYGIVTPRFEWIEAREIIGSSLRALKAMFEERRCEIVIRENADWVHTDRHLLEQVLINLLENAAKYSPSGSVVRIEAERHGNEYLLAVSDLGPGIPFAERHKVFDMFHRLEASDQKAVGTGMGLAICKGLTEALRGKISVHGQRDAVGTRIEVRLPQAGWMRGTADE